jgi:hypothetical protein
LYERFSKKKNEKKQQQKRVRPNPGKLRRARHPDG